jgi:hypothetical protein
VKIWRWLKKLGAVQLKSSTYVLPDDPVHYERFQRLAKEIIDNGGEAALVRVKDIEGMTMPPWSRYSTKPENVIMTKSQSL